MKLHELYPFPEERKSRKRLGRGRATGQGCTAGHGNKGQLSRSGRGKGPGFEGGQMPLQRRLPKHGFKNPFRVEYAPIDVTRLLAAFPDSTEITIDDIYARGLCTIGMGVKVLGSGAVGRAVIIEAHKFSATAFENIKKAGGTPKALEAEPATKETTKEG